MRTALLRLAMAGLAPDRVDRLVARHGVEGTVDLGARGRLGLGERAREAVRRSPDGIREELAKAGIAFVAAGDEGFPSWLGGLPGTPRWLFLRGRLPDAPGVAVVGSRRPSAYGLGVSRRLGRTVGSTGRAVVSGLAAGVDAAAHQGCLEGGGIAVAVLGSGIDVWYPRRNRSLGERILEEGGAVLSEFPPGTPPEAWRFPFRNRIVSGLSGVVVVVEAAARSGALITARLGLEQGREVMAVPGDIDRPTSEGCNLLVRDGAHPIVAVQEVPEMLELLLGPAPRAAPEERLPPWLATLPAPLDQVAAEAGRPLPELLSEVARLELDGLVRLEAGMVERA